MREGYYTDAYFNHTRTALLADGRHPRVVMQVFQKHESVLGGMDEAIAILKLCAEDWDALTVHALYDGDHVEPFPTGPGREHLTDRTRAEGAPQAAGAGQRSRRWHVPDANLRG